MAKSGQFSKTCGTEFKHDEWNISGEACVLVRRTIPIKTLALLDGQYKNHNYSTKVSYCKDCIAHVEKHCTECNILKQSPCISNKITVDSSTQTDGETWKLIFEDLESQQKEELAYKLAKEESKAILEDCHKLSCIYKDLEQLINLKIDVYSRKYNKVVLAFLNGVSSVNKTTENEVKICLALEQIYGLTHKYFVAPLSFVNNLIQFQSTQSKMLLNMNSKLYPGGSYSTVTNWLSSQSVRSPVYPQHDCIVAFDNDQIVGKTWNVRANNKVNVSVVTSMCAVEFESKQQFDHSIHPKLWFKYSDFTERLLDIRNREGKVYDLVHDTHYRQLYMNLEEAINLIYKEQVAALKDDYFFDDIDQSIADEPGMDQIKCLLCGMQFKKSKIKCDKCHVNIREVHKQLITPSLSKTYNEPKKRKPVEKEYNFTKKTSSKTRLQNTNK